VIYATFLRHTRSEKRGGVGAAAGGSKPLHIPLSQATHTHSHSLARREAEEEAEAEGIQNKG